jgi:hypothetical protein
MRTRRSFIVNYTELHQRVKPHMLHSISDLHATSAALMEQKQAACAGDAAAPAGKGKLSKKERIALKRAQRRAAKERRGSDDEDFEADLQDPRFEVRLPMTCACRCLGRTCEPTFHAAQLLSAQRQSMLLGVHCVWVPLVLKVRG